MTAARDQLHPTILKTRNRFVLNRARGIRTGRLYRAAAEVTCVGVFLFGGRWWDSNRVQRPAQGAEVSGSLPGEQNAVRNAERKLFSLKIRHEDAFCAIKTKKYAIQPWIYGLFKE